MPRLSSGNMSPKNSVQMLHKTQYRNWHYGSQRSRDLHMSHRNPRTGHILDRKTNKLQNMFRNIYDHFLLLCFCFFVCWNCRRAKYAQIIWSNRSVITLKAKCPDQKFPTDHLFRNALLPVLTSNLTHTHTYVLFVVAVFSFHLFSTKKRQTDRSGTANDSDNKIHTPDTAHTPHTAGTVRFRSCWPPGHPRRQTWSLIPLPQSCCPPPRVSGCCAPRGRRWSPCPSSPAAWSCFPQTGSSATQQGRRGDQLVSCPGRGMRQTQKECNTFLITRDLEACPCKCKTL